MAARYVTRCVICGAPLSYFGMGKRQRFLDYTCATCFRTYEHDEDGEVLPHASLPDWLKYLKSAETVRRQRHIYWRERGYELEPESLGEIIEQRRNRRNSDSSDMSDDDILGRFLADKKVIS